MTPTAPFNLARYVLEAGRATPDKIALAILGPARSERWSYARLPQAVEAAAGGLRAAGLRPGDYLMLRLGNDAHFPLAYLGAIWAGIVPIPTSAALTRPEVTALCAALPPAAILAGPDIALPDISAPVLTPDVLRGTAIACHDTGPDDLAYIVFTSGSSGRPKPVAHAHRAVWARRMMWEGWYGLRTEDRLLHAGAFNWTYTLGTGLLDPWAAGATALVPAAGTDPATLGLLAKRHDATILAGAPGIFRRLLRQGLPPQPELRHCPPPLPKLRHGLSAGEALPVSIRAAWRAATGTDIHEALGMSECSTFLSGSPQRPAPEGHIGYAQQGRRLAVVDDQGAPLPDGTEGTLAVHRSDPGLMLGYIDGAGAAPDLPLTGDLFLTGDRVIRGADGAYRYLGRRDALLTAGGYRIAPLEIEAAFDGAPDLSECAALTLHPTPETSILALAYSGAADEDALTRHITNRLADHKRPRAYIRLAALPRAGNGKLDRRALAHVVAEALKDPP
ncbi:class I adenylate-forming enzyme family protein [Gymnodinialimonas sp. 2305UL16-5]|uniref:class I adenylate-forming enzyme family protein n=1 Tax=Gymnodinialimonas mytili TaxID=3126503 RepID=UPI0030AFB12F